MNIDTISEGIIIGGAGGFIAGISIWIISVLREKVTEWSHKNRIYNWLYNETKHIGQGYTVGEPNDPRWRQNREIARHNNLTIDRVNYICSIHKGIILIGKEDIWPNEPLEEKWAIKKFVR